MVFGDVIMEPGLYEPSSFNSSDRTGRLLIGLVVLYYIICLRKIFKKAGLPRWGSLIPLYREFLLFKVGGLSGWYILAPIIAAGFYILAPILLAKAFFSGGIRAILGGVCYVIAAIAAIETTASCLTCTFNTARKFNKSNRFGSRLLIFNPIYIGILAFGKSTYTADAN